MKAPARWLLIDTCGENAAVALTCDPAVAAMRELPDRSASAEIIRAVSKLLEQAGCRISELNGVGVVNGPGSFTGVRTGLAAAKGLCEAAGLDLVAVSRLAVLGDGCSEGFAVLFAGRGELYVRACADGSEFLCSADDFATLARGGYVVASEARVIEMLPELEITRRELRIEDCLPLILREAMQDAALVDGNYVRRESDIYKKSA